LELAFASPRKLPRAREVKGRVAVVDIAFASEASGGGFEKITKPFIDGLGSRLVAWVDHHDSKEHARYAADPRFLLATKAQHGACPEMVTPEVVTRFGDVDSIVCHTDFDGLVSAAKWIRKGIECYPGCDADAYAIDTRIGKPSSIADRFDRALRVRYRDLGLLGLMVRHLSTGLADASLWAPIDEAVREFDQLDTDTRRLADAYVRLRPGVAVVDCSERRTSVDKTLLLLLGQERERVAVVVDRDTITMAAAFDSGIDFLKLMGLSGGMPTRVSVPRKQLQDVWKALGVDASEGDAALKSALPQPDFHAPVPLATLGRAVVGDGHLGAEPARERDPQPTGAQLRGDHLGPLASQRDVLSARADVIGKTEEHGRATGVLGA
jgi:hypothetical protein